MFDKTGITLEHEERIHGRWGKTRMTTIGSGSKSWPGRENNASGEPEGNGEATILNKR